MEMTPIPNYVIKSIQIQQELLKLIPQIHQIPLELLDAMQSAQLLQEQLPIKMITAQSEILNSAIDSVIALEQQIPHIIEIQKSILPFLSLAKEAMEFNDLINLIKSKRLHFPYPYTTKALILISKKLKTENDIRKDLIKKLRSGEILILLKESVFPKLEFKGKSGVKNLINLVLDSLANPDNENYLEVLWLFPLTEKIIQEYFYSNLINIRNSLMTIHDRIDKILKMPPNINNLELINKRGRINEALKSILDIQNSYNKLDLGTFLHIIELSVDNWPADKAFQIVSIMILSRFVNFRNDFIHGRILKIKPKHLAISLSFFIMVLNILLIENEYKPILFELEESDMDL